MNVWIILCLIDHSCCCFVQQGTMSPWVEPISSQTPHQRDIDSSSPSRFSLLELVPNLQNVTERQTLERREKREIQITANVDLVAKTGQPAARSIDVNISSTRTEGGLFRSGFAFLIPSGLLNATHFFVFVFVFDGVGVSSPWAQRRHFL